MLDIKITIIWLHDLVQWGIAVGMNFKARRHKMPDKKKRMPHDQTELSEGKGTKLTKKVFFAGVVFALLMTLLLVWTVRKTDPEINAKFISEKGTVGAVIKNLNR